MIRISTAARLSIGLVSLTICILFGAEMLGLIPNPKKAIQRERENISEFLVIYSYVAAQKDDIEMLLTASRLLVDRNEAILSAAVRGADGTIMMSAGDHEQHWKGAPEKDSIPTHVRVPIYKGKGILWGTVEIAFQSVKKNGLYWIWSNSFVKLIVFVILAGLILYRLFLGRTLRHLDPTSVVPPRVKAALDALSEGIILMDPKERIVHTNAVFADKIGRSASSLLGCKASGLDWTLPKSTEAPKDYPWFGALHDSKSQTGIQLGLLVGPNKWQTYMVNSTPILDQEGKCRGALATFDDVTEVEEKNEQLGVMLTKLQKSKNEIREKNKELEILATRDPLTGCLNRRSFFEKFEVALGAARRYKHDLGCIMFDIDHFKSVNDNYGHATGDLVLKGVTEVVRSMLRDSDIFCRYGGEEFCVILPHIGLDGASKAAERYRKGIESHDFSNVAVTTSFGVSSSEFGAAKPSELLEQADKSLYAAKDTGRNRVVGWTELNSEGDVDVEEKTVTIAADKKIDAPIVQEAGVEEEIVEEFDGGDDNVDVEEKTVTIAADKKIDAPIVQEAGVEEEIVGEFDGGDENVDVEEKTVTIAANKKIDAPIVQEAGVEEEIVGEFDGGDENLDALKIVGEALSSTARKSESMGLHASSHISEDSAIQLNLTGGWGDDGKTEEKDRPDPKAIKKAAEVLMEPQ